MRSETERHGTLRNGNPPGDPSKAPRCGARTRRGSPCQAPWMPNGRCRLHGGLSTGPKTPEGLERSRRANWKHGAFSAEYRAKRRKLRETLRWLRLNLAIAEQQFREILRERRLRETRGPRPDNAEESDPESALFMVPAIFPLT